MKIPQVKYKSLRNKKAAHLEHPTFVTTNLLADNTGPAIVDGNASAVDDTSSLAISHRSAEASNLLQIAVRSFDRLKDSVHLLVSFHVEAGLERIGDVGLHGAHHKSIALDALGAVESGSVLGQTDKAVFAGGIGGTYEKTH